MRGRIFATLASQKHGYGNLMLTPEQQAESRPEQTDLFLPIAGGSGRMERTISVWRRPMKMWWPGIATACRLRIEKTKVLAEGSAASATESGLAEEAQ